jgi:hypothetical protein
VTLVSFDDIGAADDDDAGFEDAFGVPNTADFLTSVSNGGTIRFSELGMGCF